MNKDIFISHSSKDKKFVRKLTASLENSGISCWLDEAELKVGDSIIQKIGEGVYKSSYIGAIISSNSVESPWVQKELQMAMTREISDRKIRVLPIIIDDCQNRLPYFLRDKLYADFNDHKQYQKTIESLIKVISDRSENCSKTIEKVGELDIGNSVHELGNEFFGLRFINSSEKQSIFTVSVATFLLMIAIFLKSTLKPHLVTFAKLLGIPGCCLLLGGLLKMPAGYLIRKSFDRNRRILIEWELQGDPIFVFTLRWRNIYRKCKTDSYHRVGMIILGVGMILEAIAVLSFFIIFIKQII